jgi:hypothetical protein
MKKCIISPVIKEIQIKTTLRFHLIPVRLAIINGNNHNKCWWGCGKTGILIHCWWECKLVKPLWKAVQRFLKKLEIEQPYDPVIPLLGTCPKDTIETPEHRCSLQNCSQKPSSENNPGAYNWWLDQEIVVFIHNGVLLSHKE